MCSYLRAPLPQPTYPRTAHLNPHVPQKQNIDNEQTSAYRYASPNGQPQALEIRLCVSQVSEHSSGHESPLLRNGNRQPKSQPTHGVVGRHSQVTTVQNWAKVRPAWRWQAVGVAASTLNTRTQRKHLHPMHLFNSCDAPISMKHTVCTRARMK